MKMVTTLTHQDAMVQVEELPTGKQKVAVSLTNTDLFMPKSTCETAYPLGLITNILDIKGPAYLCDEILRDESPQYVEKHLRYELLGYLVEEEFKAKRLLDFGCGSGASTMVLARMFPDTEIVGIELEKNLLSLAQLRAEYYGYENVKLMVSPSPESLPPQIGSFDYVVLSAVYEHLLPNEREMVLSHIWRILKPNGILFINQTPYRYSPVEMHTTSGLPLINYLPDKLAMYYAQYFSKRNLRNESWERLLRKGIRGGGVKEILTILAGANGTPVLLSPSRFGMKDRIDLWYTQSGSVRFVLLKRSLRLVLKLIHRLTGVVIVPSLSLAIQKRRY